VAFLAPSSATLSCSSSRDRLAQLHSGEYRYPLQLQQGGVGWGGQLGAEIALDVLNDHLTWLAGRDGQHVPFRGGSAREAGGRDGVERRDRRPAGSRLPITNRRLSSM
jgi:hypothetical protein